MSSPQTGFRDCGDLRLCARCGIRERLSGGWAVIPCEMVTLCFCNGQRLGNGRSTAKPGKLFAAPANAIKPEIGAGTVIESKS